MYKDDKDSSTTQRFTHTGLNPTLFDGKKMRSMLDTHDFRFIF